MKVNNYYAKNQFDLYVENKHFFQSYESIIAQINNQLELTLYEDYDYSKTTAKYLKIWLMEFYWLGRDKYIELLNKMSSSKALTKMIKEGYIIRGY